MSNRRSIVISLLLLGTGAAAWAWSAAGLATEPALRFPTNPLGVKGVGEAGTTGGIGAIMIAVCNALGERGYNLQMPATTEKIWRALRGPAS